jgi:hypothetical protein
MAEKIIRNAASNGLILVLFFGISAWFFLRWLPVHSPQIPAFEEGLLDVSAVHYSADYLRHHFRLPQLWQNRTYSQSLDEQYYQATFVELPATLIAAIFSVDALRAVVFSHILLTAVILMFIYLTLRHCGLGSILAAAGALIYLVTNAYYLAGVSHGQMRYLSVLAGLAMTVYFAILYADRLKGSPIRGLMLLPGIALGSLMLGQGNLSLLLQALLLIAVLPFALRKKVAMNLKRLIVVGLIVIAILGYCFFKIQKAKAIEPDPTIAALFFNEAPNLFSAFNLSLGNLNRPPFEVQNFNYTWRTEALAATVLALAIIGLILDADLGILGLWIIGFAILATGPNGPLAPYMNWFPYFRSSGRTFCIFLHYGIILLFAFTLDMGFRKFRSRPGIRMAIGILLAILVVPAFTLEREKLVVNREMDPRLEEAYRRIPSGSTIGLLPQRLKDSTYSDNNQNYALYRQDFAVPLSLLHQHEYLSEKYNLQNTTTPPNDWTIPILTRNQFAYLDRNIEKGRWDEIRKQLAFLHPDLGYWVIYTKLIQPNVIQGFQSIGWNPHFQNELVTVLKSPEAKASKFSAYPQVLLTFSDNYETGVSGIASLPHDAARKNLFVNSDKNLGEILPGNDPSSPLLLNNYDPDNLIYDAVYRDGKVGKHLHVDCRYCTTTDFYQPSIHKNLLQASSRPIELSGAFRGAKTCMIRIFSKRSDLSNLKISGDGRPVSFRKIGRNNNFFYIKTEVTQAGAFSITHKDAVSTDVDALDVIYIDAGFCATEHELDEEMIRLQNLWRSRYHYLSIIEPESRSIGTGASVLYGNQINQSLSRNEAVCVPSDLRLNVMPPWLRKGQKINIYLVADKSFMDSGKGTLTQKDDSTGGFRLSGFDRDVLDEDGTVTLKSKSGFCLDSIHASNQKIDQILSFQTAAPVGVASKDPQSFLLHCGDSSIVFRNSYSPNWSFGGRPSLIANFFQNGQIGLNCPALVKYQEKP